MRRGVKPQKKKTASAAIIAIVLNVVVWGGLALLFEIHKIVVRNQIEASLITMKEAPFRATKLPPAKKVLTKEKEKRKSTAKGGHTKAKPGPPHPHLMSGTPSNGGKGGASGPTVQSGGSGKAGVVSGGPPTPKPPTPPPPPPVKKTTEPEKKTVVAPPTKPVVTKQIPVELHQAPSGPTTAAQPSKIVQPQIPDSLREEAMTTSVTTQVAVAADGSFQVKLLSSSGNSEMDQLVLDAMKQWTWSPALANGIPVSTTVDYQVKINVS